MTKQQTQDTQQCGPDGSVEQIVGLLRRGVDLMCNPDPLGLAQEGWINEATEFIEANAMTNEKTQGGPPVAVKRLVGCARCGKTHRDLSFRKLARPCGDLTHWTLCPTSGEPILMQITANAKSERPSKSEELK